MVNAIASRAGHNGRTNVIGGLRDGHGTKREGTTKKKGETRRRREDTVRGMSTLGSLIEQENSAGSGVGRGDREREREVKKGKQLGKQTVRLRSMKA